MKIFVCTPLNSNLQSALAAQLPTNHTLIFKSVLSEAEARQAFQNADVVMGNPPVEWVTEAPGNLQFWQLDSAGFDQYQYVQTNAVVANMGDFFSLKCAETIVGGILAFYRHIHELVRFQSEKKWVGKKIRYSIDMLSEKRVIILGAGTIARAIKKILTGFDCTIQMTARKNPNAQIHTLDDLLSRLADTDLVINTLPGKADKYVSATFFDALRSSAVYASIGRGNTTDESALIGALESGKLAGAVLDVTEEEPLPTSSKLWAMDNVILTQHTGGGYKYEDEGKIEMFVSNFNKFLDGREIKQQIKLSEGY